MVHHNLFACSLQQNSKNEQEKTNYCSPWQFELHTSAEISAFLTGQNVELMAHPTYSADLALNDFFLFQHIKKKMRCQRFSSPKDAVEAFNNHVLEVSQSERKKCFAKQFERMCTIFDDQFSDFHYQARNISSNPCIWPKVKLQVNLFYFDLLKANEKIQTLSFDLFAKITEVYRMMPIYKVNLRYSIWVSLSYKISDFRFR